MDKHDLEQLYRIDRQLSSAIERGDLGGIKEAEAELYLLIDDLANGETLEAELQ